MSDTSVQMELCNSPICKIFYKDLKFACFGLVLQCELSRLKMEMEFLAKVRGGYKISQPRNEINPAFL